MGLRDTGEEPPQGRDLVAADAPGAGRGRAALAFAAAHLYWAFGGTAGLHDDALDDRNVPQQLADGVWGVLAVAGAAALVLIVRRAGGPGPLAVPLSAAWVGSAATFTGSLYGLLVMIGGRTPWRRTSAPRRA